MEFNLLEVKPEDLSKDSVYYIVRNVINNHSYVGIATHGLRNRVFNNVYGYVTDVTKNYISRRDELIRDYEGASNLVLEVKVAMAIYGLENFVISAIGSGDDPNLSEEILIARYNSILNGYNKTIDGLGTTCTKYHLVTYSDSKGRLINLPESMSDVFINMGLSRSFKHWVNYDSMSKIVHDYELDEYLSNGYSLGRGEDYTSPARGKVMMNKDLVPVAVDPSEINEYLEKGYSLGRGKSSITGKVAVSKNGTIKYIDRSEVESYLSKGYSPGFRGVGKPLHASAQDKRVMTDPNGNYGYVDVDKVDELLEMGYTLGHPEGYETKRSKRFSVNDGTRYWYVESQEEADDLVRNHGLNYGIGNVKINRLKVDRVAVNNGEKFKRIRTDELEEYLSKGWKKGGLRKKYGSYKKKEKE